MSPFVEISLILALATVVALVMQMLRLPLVLGHLLTGILVGPAVLNLIHSPETIDIFSKLGITALLFIVGLSLAPQVFREVGKASVITGLGQIVFTTAIGYGIGIAIGFGQVAAFLLAFAFTFSSTIIITKLLADKNDLGKLYGKIAVGFLIVQDLAATLALIVITSIAAGGDPTTAGFAAVGKILGLGVILYLLARFVLPWMTRIFAASQEFLLLFAVGWGVGLSALFSVIGLSAEIGALLAGITLAASPYHYEISAKMKLLRDFFIILFFVSLGAQQPIAGLAPLLRPAMIFSLFVLIGNPIIVMILMGLLGYAKKTSFFAGLTVAQISEFSLLLLFTAAREGFVSSTDVTLATLVAIITIAGSSILILAADPIYRVLAPLLTIFERARPKKERNRRERFDAVLFGCHRVGSDFLPTLEHLKLKTLVVDFDPAVVDRLTRQGVTCRYGDADDNEFLDEIGLAKLRVFISTIPDFDSNAFLLSKLRKANRRAIAVLTAQSVDEAEVLYRSGASYVILPHFLGGNVAALMMDKLGPSLSKFAEERKRHLAHLAARHAQV